MSSATLPRRIPGFDGLRAVACIWVIAVHYATCFQDIPIWNPAVLRFCLRGELGVPLFFALSGFLLAWPFVTAMASPHDRWKFTVDRLSRILPAYFACLLVMGAYQIAREGFAGTAETAARVVSAAACVNVWHPAVVYPLPRNAALWSVPVEIWFYGLFVCLLPFLFTRPAASVQRFWLVLTGAVVVALGVPPLLDAVQSLWDPAVATAVRWDAPQQAFGRAWMTTHNPLALFPQFLGGVGLALLVARSGWLWMPGRRRWPFDLAALLPAVVMLGVDWHTTGPFGQGISAVTAYGFPVFTLLTVAFMFCLLASGRLAQLADAPPLRRVAMYSFGIYLWHTPLVFLLERLGTPQTPLALAGGFLLVFLVACAIGAASFHLLEQPARRWMQRTFRRPAVTAALWPAVDRRCAATAADYDGPERRRTILA